MSSAENAEGRAEEPTSLAKADFTKIELWLPVTGIITGVTGVVGYALLPVSGMRNNPSLIVVTMWMTLMTIVGLAYFGLEMVQRMRAGEQDAFRTLIGSFGRRRLASVYLGCFIVSLNLAFFGIIKPELGQFRSFSADPLLANLDHRILGADAWTLVKWLNNPILAPVYHEGWFIWLAVVLFMYYSEHRLRNKDCLLISYILIWSFFWPSCSLNYASGRASLL